MRLSTHRFSCIRETSATTSPQKRGCSWRTQTALPLTTDRPDRTVHAATRAAAGKFLLAGLGSFFASAPLGAWTAVHLWSSLAAFDSPRAWQDAVTAHSSLASRVLLSILVVGPLLWHTIWGMVRFARTRPNLDLTAFSNVRYLLQRLAALGLLAAPGALPLGCNRPA